MAVRKYGLVREPVAANGTADSPKVRGNRWGKAPSAGWSLVPRAVRPATMQEQPGSPTQGASTARSPPGKARWGGIPSWKPPSGEFPKLEHFWWGISPAGARWGGDPRVSASTVTGATLSGAN